MMYLRLCVIINLSEVNEYMMPKVVLIIRTSAMGDIVMASPLIKGLKQRFPDARLLWLVEPAFANLLNEHPLLDGVIIFDKGRWRRSLKKGDLAGWVGELCSLRNRLRQEQVDLVLDVQGLLRTRFLARLSGAPERIGLVSKEPGDFLMTRILSKGGDGNQMSSEYCHLLELLGAQQIDCSPELFVAETDQAAAREQLNEAGIGEAYVAFAPFTTRPQKHWFDERWSELAVALGKRLGLRSVLLGGPTDAERAVRIASSSDGYAANMAGRLPLMQSAALLSQATLVIGVDTGLVHMGTAFRRPTVALFGATRPYLETSSPLTRVLYHPFPCSPCRRSPSCSGEYPCMASLSLEEVLEAGVRLCEQEGSTS